jgi:hypothetical protein
MTGTGVTADFTEGEGHNYPQMGQTEEMRLALCPLSPKPKVPYVVGLEKGSRKEMGQGKAVPSLTSSQYCFPFVLSKTLDMSWSLSKDERGSQQLKERTVPPSYGRGA